MDSPQTTIRPEKVTPLLRQYQAVKRGVGDAILLFRLGDFYEMFNEDAIIASKILGILLTKKSAGHGNSVPLAGVPAHSAESYIARLVRAGKKVAICEQTEDPAKAKGLVDRNVVRIVTAGTLVEENLLPPNVDNFLGAAACAEGEVGLACVDISTGDFKVGSWPIQSDSFKNTLGLLPLREVVIPEDASAAQNLEPCLKDFLFPLFRRSAPPAEETIENLGRRFGAVAVQASGFPRHPAILAAIGLIQTYLAETRSEDLPICFPRFFPRDGVMDLDAATVRNLEILAGISGDPNAGLLSVIDRAKTPMGSRSLRRWLLSPLTRASEIIQRQAGVSALVENPSALDAVRGRFADIGDLERILSRLARPATARVADLVTLRRSFDAMPEALKELGRLSAFGDDVAQFPAVQPLRDLLRSRLAESPSAVLGEGKVLRAGVHPELDELRELLENQRLHLLKFQDAERARTGVQSLKVSYNKIYGYYIEISSAKIGAVPSDYIRKQTLVNAERYITPELKKFEEKLLAAADRIQSIERELFNQLLTDVLAHAETVRSAAERIARVDALAALADTARRERFVKPEMVDEDILEIRAGRHPVVERFCPNGFVPNDTFLSPERRLAIVTGPNMAGKSTFIRQTAVLTLLAQIGSYVPAQSFRLRPVDRIFTRIGAQDDLSRGQSTFFVEMSETAAILRQATNNSLILLDEIGRGTSTYDGLSIAWSVVEHIARNIGAKTLFATHYHELVELADPLAPAELSSASSSASPPRSGIHTLTVLVREWEGRVVFLRKVVDGASDRSFGIAVADMAGIPRSVLDRARTLLSEFESGIGARDAARKSSEKNPEDLFSSSLSIELEDLKRRLCQMPLDRLTPIEAMTELAQIQKDLGVPCRK